MSCAATRFALEEATVDFGPTRALDRVSLAIEPGEAVAFVGPSGSGKTTLLRLLNAGVRPTEGSVRLGERSFERLTPRQLREVRSCIGFIHQDYDLVPNLRVLQNVIAGRLGQMSLPASLRAMLLPSRGMVREAYRVLDRVGIPQKMYERTDRLSGGQRQRVAIARALFQSPVALLADEPVSSVDPARARDTVALLRALSEERGITLGMSLHNLDLAREFFPRLIGMRNGRIVFDAPTQSIEREAFESLYKLSAREILDERE